MESVGVRELRQNLSVYLRRVGQGEALRVTERGRPVALLAPLPPDEDPLAQLVRAGVVTPAADGTDDLPEPVALPDDGGPLVSELLIAGRRRAR